MKKLALVGMGIALVILATAVAWADVIPPQVTMGLSKTNGLVFTVSPTTVTLNINGVMSGNTWLDPLGDSGIYEMWMTGGPISLINTGGGNYDVDMGTAVIYLLAKLGPHGDGSLGTFSSHVTLTGLHGGSGNTPQFDLAFHCVTATGDFLTLFPLGATGEGDFTVDLPTGSGVIQRSWTYTLPGHISSGEIVSPTPEPGTLLMLGSGLLGAVGVLRRKLF